VREVCIGSTEGWEEPGVRAWLGDCSTWDANAAFIFETILFQMLQKLRMYDTDFLEFTVTP